MCVDFFPDDAQVDRTGRRYDSHDGKPYPQKREPFL